MELHDLRPKQSAFFLNSTGIAHSLRPMTLGDEIWMKHEFGDKVSEIFSDGNADMEAVCKIVYRLIENKRPFAAVEVEDYNESGVLIKKMLGGAERFFSMVNTYKEKIDIVVALHECMGISREILESLVEDDEDDTEKKTLE